MMELNLNLFWIMMEKFIRVMGPWTIIARLIFVGPQDSQGTLASIVSLDITTVAAFTNMV